MTFEQLRQTYPSAAINGRAKGVVGKMGLVVGYVTKEGCAAAKHYEPGDLIPIEKIVEENYLKLDVGLSECTKKVIVNHNFFESFI